MVVWFSGLARATPLNCSATVEKAELDEALGQAETAVGALDETALAEAVERARGLVLCVDAELRAPDIARLYRLSGISRYVGGDLVQSVAEFEVAKALAPDGVIDPKLGRPLRMTYDAVPPPTGETRVLPPPTNGWTDVDGGKTDNAPIDRGFFLQWVGDDGGVRGTWLVGEGDEIPYPMGAEVATTERHGRPLLITGIVGMVAGAGAIAGAAVLEHQFTSSDVPSAEQGGLVTTNRVLGFGGIGLGIAGLGLTGVSLAVGF